jgi:hypothetical protein
MSFIFYRRARSLVTGHVEIRWTRGHATGMNLVAISGWVIKTAGGMPSGPAKGQYSRKTSAQIMTSCHSYSHAERCKWPAPQMTISCFAKRFHALANRDMQRSYTEAIPLLYSTPLFHFPDPGTIPVFSSRKLGWVGFLGFTKPMVLG